MVRGRVAVVAAVAVVGMLLTGAAAGQAGSEVAVIPRPVRVERLEGHFTLTPETRLVAPGEAGATGRQLAAYLAGGTGFWLDMCEGEGSGSRIELRLEQGLRELGDDGYRLEVGPEEVVMTAGTEAGLFYAVQTFRQLLPVEIFREGKVEGVEWKAPCVRIEDQPRFEWRGMHLDVGRYFMPKEFVKKYIDLIALHKMNVFHWHLTEDAGWRLEIKRYPRLTEVGAWRPETIVGKTKEYDGKPHGGYYTHEDVREIVAYAAARHVRVVPEIDMPGHVQAAIAAYPELGSRADAAEAKVATRWGTFDYILNVDPETIEFMQNVLAEVVELFPSEYIHIGGDEANWKVWEQSERVQARMKELGIETERDLQSWFVKQMAVYLERQGRRLLGWDEILEGGLAEGAVVMAWRGEERGIAAAREGHDVVMTPRHYTYFDYYQGPPESEPLAIGGFLPLEKVYGYEPVPAELTAEEGRRVLGAQGQIWGEYISEPKYAEYMAYPRGCALAEVVWSRAEGKDYDKFLKRLEVHLGRLEALDVNYRALGEAAD